MRVWWDFVELGLLRVRWAAFVDSLWSWVCGEFIETLLRVGWGFGELNSLRVCWIGGYGEFVESLFRVCWEFLERVLNCVWWMDFVELYLWRACREFVENLLEVRWEFFDSSLRACWDLLLIICDGTVQRAVVHSMKFNTHWLRHLGG